MKSKIEQPEFSPTSITFETQQEVIWLKGLLATNSIYEAVREVNADAVPFFDNLYNAFKESGTDTIIGANKFAEALEKQL